MRLDHTQIAIRERGFLEILDLALLVVRAHLVPLTLGALVGALPMYLVNLWLIGWMIDADYVDTWLVRYVWLMTLLVCVEAPLASAPITLYLGQAMFYQRLAVRQLLRDCLPLARRLVVCQFLLRGVLPAWLLVLAIERYGDFSPMIEILLLPLLVLIVLLVRASRPFINEILLLERNPLVSRGSETMSINRRSGMLHMGSRGDLFGRWIGSALVAVPMVVSFVFCQMFISGVFFGSWHWGVVMVGVCIPAAMWIVAAYFAVVRFLSYLDLRIRREGWEVELQQRAAAAPLVRSVA